MKVFIINYNRVTLAKNLADWCAANKLVPVIIDNNSDYKPLLDYYNGCPYEVIRMPKNYGHTVMWNPETKLLNDVNERYIVTDSDLDLSAVPSGFLRVMHYGLDKYPQFPKCGLSLEINDLPDLPKTHRVKNECEAQYWQTPLDPIYFNAPVDTTFAMYREGVKHYTLEAIRTNRPYTARHVPWYYTDFEKLPDDEKNYFRTANGSSTAKARLI